MFKLNKKMTSPKLTDKTFRLGLQKQNAEDHHMSDDVGVVTVHTFFRARIRDRIKVRSLLTGFGLGVRLMIGFG